METQQGVLENKTTRIIKKSPQELAAQIQSVSGTYLEFTKHPEGKQLDERYEKIRSYVKKLLESGISNNQLEKELQRLYEQGKKLGIYSPPEQGYLAMLRKWRRTHERIINRYFQDSIERHPITKTEEYKRIKQLQKRVIYLTKPEQTKVLSAQFPGGNYLYHGTRVEQAISILESGNLSNAKRLYDAEEERIKREGGQKKILYIIRGTKVFHGATIK